MVRVHLDPPEPLVSRWLARGFLFWVQLRCNNYHDLTFQRGGAGVKQDLVGEGIPSGRCGLEYPGLDC